MLTIQIFIPQLGADPESISRIISRVVAGNQYEAVLNRLNELNDRYFGFLFQQLRLKYNSSNWGSCSTKKNINLSTRLLFAPLEVQDYVMIHELAHLKEPNHSNRFWALVSHVDPDYRAKEKVAAKEQPLMLFLTMSINKMDTDQF